MTVGFRSGLETTVAGDLGESPSPGLLDSGKENPQVLPDRPAAASPSEPLAATGAGGVRRADWLPDSLRGALAGALDGVFAVLAFAAALSFAVALFLPRAARRGENEANRIAG